MICFYESLKDDIKNDLYKEDMLDTFIEYIQCMVKIDDRLYICCIEKYGQGPLVLK